MEACTTITDCFWSCGNTKSSGNQVGTVLRSRQVAHLVPNDCNLEDPTCAPMIHLVCCYSKTFWLLAGPSGIEFGRPGPLDKDQSFDLQA